MGAAIAAIAGAAIAAGGAVYAGSQKKKASAQLADSLGNYKEFEPALLKGDPKMVDTRAVGLRTVDEPYDRLGYIREFVDKLNAIDYSTAMKYYRKIQPSFDAIQRQVGTNALSFAKGEIPADVSAEITRKAAERGIQAGFGFGSQGGRTGALANLNLRNLGLTSLDLSRFGTQLGMQVNQSAKGLLPNFRSVADFILTPGQQLAAEQANVQSINQREQYNNQLVNQGRLQNTSAANVSMQGVAQQQYAGQVGEAEMWAQIASSVGGAVGGLGGGAGGAGGIFGGTSGAAGSNVNSLASNPGYVPTNTGAWRSNATSFTQPIA